MNVVFDAETVGGFEQAHPDFRNLFFGYRKGNKSYYDIQPRLQDGDVVIGANTKYDLRCYIKEFGSLPDVSVVDVQVAAHFINETLSSYKLEELAKLFRYPCMNWKGLVNFKEEYWHDLETLRLYNSHDLGSTDWIWNKARPVLETRGQLPIFGLVMEAAKTLAEVELKGIAVDVQELARQRDILDEQITTTNLKLMSYGNINWQSPPQVTDWFKKHKVKLPKTKLGNESSSEAALKKLAEQGNETAKTLLDYRGYTKQRGTYVGCEPDNCEEEHDHKGFWQVLIDNTYYPSYNLTRTVSGRYSERYGQVWPRKDTSEFKKCLISKFPDGRLIEIDWSQLELRLIAETIASVTGDHRMADDLNGGLDIHAETLKKFPFIPNRTKAKNCNFLVGYNGREAKLVYEYGFTWEQAKAFIHDLKVVRYPGMGQWHEQVEYDVLQHRKVTNTVKRTRHTDNVNEAINFYIQPLGHDMNKLAMVLLHRNLVDAGTKSHVIGEVHDSTLIDQEPREGECVQEVIRETYQSFKQEWKKVLGFDLQLDYGVECKIGKNLYDMSSIENKS